MIMKNGKGVETLRILGIDPGYGITGFGLIEAERGKSALLQCGAITTPAGMDFPARLEIIYRDMVELLELSKPDAIAIEELFFGHNVTTAIGVAQSRGVILLAAQQAVDRDAQGLTLDVPQRHLNTADNSLSQATASSAFAAALMIALASPFRMRSQLSM